MVNWDIVCYNIFMNITFYCISTDRNKDTRRLFQEACEELSINFVHLNPTRITLSDIEDVKSTDLMYRISDVFNKDAMELEYAILSKGVTSFYKDDSPLNVNLEESDSFLLVTQGIKTPQSFFFAPDLREELKKVVDKLGGFPIILKTLGGSHGVGVMKFDSYSSLFSVIDFLKENSTRFVLKQFINVSESARLIVLGDKVIDSIAYISPDDDFRSNEGSTPNVLQKSYSSEIQAEAVKAVKALNLEFGGVDIMIDDSGFYVVEVNFPAYHPRAELLTKTPISKMMIQFLIDKSQGRKF